MDLYIAPNGCDDAPVTRDAPLATPVAALERLRECRRTGFALSSPVTLWFESGTYALDGTLEMGPGDGGTESAPVTWRALPEAEVRWSGALAVDPSLLEPVSAPVMLKRLAPSVREHVCCLDLTALGIGDTGGTLPQGFSYPRVPADMDLYHADRPLPPARWPRTGYARIGTVHAPGTRLGDSEGAGRDPDSAATPPCGATFAGDAASIARWRQPRNLACFGMWARDWAPATLPVASTDPQAGTITLASPSCYGVTEGHKYFVQNIIEEIACPGDWAVDREDGVLYLYPPGPVESLQLTVSSLTEPLVKIKGATGIVLRDLVIEGGRGDGIVIEGDGNRVSACTLRNLGGRGIVVHGTRNRIRACHIHATGQGGIGLAGGDRPRLIPGGNRAENNDIHDVNRVCTTYNPSIHLEGCGHIVRHNHLHDGPHNAILMGGNDHLIEFNEIDHIAQGTDDAAAIYYGRNPSEQGNVVRHNFFHHVGSPSAWGTSAIYPDDGASGLTIYGNVFYRCGHAGQVSMAAIFINSGKDHQVENNIFIDCRLAMGLMLMTPADWIQFLHGEGRHGYMRERLYGAVDIRSETYLQRYPQLASIEENPGVNVFRRNLAVNCGRLVAPQEQQIVEQNWQTSSDPGFADAAHLDFSLVPQSEVYRRIPGFEPIPFDRIGLQVDADRRALPPRQGVDCLLEVAQRPLVERPGEKAGAILRLRISNLSDQPVQGTADLWSMHPESLLFPDGESIAFDLSGGGIVHHDVYVEVTARPDIRQAIGVRVRGEVFSLPVPVRPRYRIPLPRRDAPVPSLTGECVDEGAGFHFLNDAATVGSVCWALHGETLVLNARIADHRVGESQTAGWTGSGADWKSQMFGILTAPIDATGTDAVRQLVFFPHGSDGKGTVQVYAGIACLPPPLELQWQAMPQPEGGWKLAALIPLSILGQHRKSQGFRFEAMANTVNAPDDTRKLVTLFGSRTAQLELDTLADVVIADGELSTGS